MSDFFLNRFQQLIQEWKIPFDVLSRLMSVNEAELKNFFYAQDHDPQVRIQAQHLVAVDERLRSVFPDVADRLDWLNTPHSEFGDMSPLEFGAKGPEELGWLSYTIETRKSRGLSLIDPKSK